ncbi:MAG: hypothetical protein HZB80_02200 [Deltaproteobacteria bacterium]|nr:hypothetical protein [Deltaproteobacteria bacterium]
MKRIIALFIILFFAFPLASIAGAPAWWTQKKQECGLPSSLAYNTWESQGSPCNKSGSSSSGSTSSGDLGKALGQALGNAIADSIRKNREEAARQAVEEQARAAEESRRQEEETLKWHEEMKNRLLGNMMGVGDSSQLGLMGADSGSGLSLMTDDLQVRETSGAFGQKELKPIIGDDQTTSIHVDTSVVDLSDTSLADANKALMRHQWAMSIDPRYMDDPAVQQYIRDLWKNASSKDDAEAKIKSILEDQLKVSGLTKQQVDDFFATFDTFVTGQGPMPKGWGNASKLAHEIDATINNDALQKPYYDTLSKSLGKTKNIKADVSYMGTGPQTSEDCVLHAISNGAQVPLAQVKAQLEPTLKSLAIARSEVRKNPDLAVTSQDKGGTGGLNIFEEILIAKKVGNVIAVPDKNFAKAIESTGRPVITSVFIDAYDKKKNLVNIGNHEVAVTGVYRAENGKVYYSVMDSNLKKYANYTAYIEKTDFENHMLFGGGYVVIPSEKH